MEINFQRPKITDYKTPEEYLTDVLKFRKKTEASFSVARNTVTLRRISPTLISLIMKGQRRITVDRCDELAKLLDLSSSEKVFFKNWVRTQSDPDSVEKISIDVPVSKRRKNVSLSLLNDWVNVYVKDLFQIKEIQLNPQMVFRKMAHIAAPARVEKSLKFLLKEGYLRKTLDHQIVIDTNLAVADRKVPSGKVRRFHKGALKIAQAAIDLFPQEERLANAMTITLNKQGYEDLMEIIDDFTQNLQNFAANNPEGGDELYQIILNVSPVGGKLK